MALVVVAALIVWRSAPVLPLAALAVGVAYPLVGAVALVAWGLIDRSRRRPATATPDEEARFLVAVAGELSAGSAPRRSITEAARTLPTSEARRRLRAAVDLGLDHHRIGLELERLLPTQGRRVGTALLVGARSGAPMAPVFAALADRAASEGRLARERRVQTAQARATAWIIGGLPCALIVVMAGTGRLGAPGALPLVLAGVVLQAIGVGVMVILLRRRL